MRALINDLTQAGVIKHGDFTLKSGQKSSLYIDLRQIVAFPALLNRLTESLWEQVRGYPFDLICGVPYTALPMATLISVRHEIPMIIRRKEAKDYGTKKILEGIFQPGQNCLIVEDVITTGSSVIETIDLLHAEDLKVTDVVVAVDREQGGKANIEAKGCRVHPLIKLSELTPS